VAETEQDVRFGRGRFSLERRGAAEAAVTTYRQMPRYRRQRWREMPSFFILDWSVVRFMPGRAAAPAGPPITPFGKQRCGAMTLVVVCQRPRTALLQGQTGRGGLNLNLLIQQSQRMLGGRQLQSDDVFELLDKLGVTGDLEGLDQMRLEPIGTPATRCYR
jgi:hypothetical protein